MSKVTVPLAQFGIKGIGNVSHGGLALLETCAIVVT